MKIAYILDTYPSLTETFIAREIEALRRRGFEIEIFALSAGAGAHKVLLPSGRARTLGLLERALTRGVRPNYWKKLGAAFWQDAQRQGLMQGVLHIHAGWASHPAFIAWGASEASGLPWSFSGHARDLFVEGASLDGKLGAARFAAACTRMGEERLQEAAPDQAHKIIYAPHGIEVGRYEFCPPNLQEPLRILSVGRLVEKKGFSYLLQALQLLKEQGSQFKATIIGEGPSRTALQRECVEAGLSRVVNFAGALAHDQVLAAMRDANCFVAPSILASDGDRDGLPNVLLEAAACGVPIVAANAGSITDFLDGATARLCPPADARVLAMSISETFAEAGSTLARCSAARARVEERFDVEKNIERLAQAFKM
jgi:glycosyltransferase involved in cell wall biosynthesis